MSQSPTLSPPGVYQPPRALTPVRAVIAAGAVLSLGTLAIAAIVAAVPPLAAAVRDALPVRLDGANIPHEPGEVVRIAANNLAVAGSMLLTAALAARMRRTARLVCDVLAASIVARSAVLVGAVLGSRTTDLVPYLPHLPLEWAAIATASGAWLYARRRPLSGRQLAAFTVATVALVLAAAVLETYATPR